MTKNIHQMTKKAFTLFLNYLACNITNLPTDQLIPFSFLEVSHMDP